MRRAASHLAQQVGACRAHAILSAELTLTEASKTCPEERDGLHGAKKASDAPSKDGSQKFRDSDGRPHERSGWLRALPSKLAPAGPTRSCPLRSRQRRKDPSPCGRDDELHDPLVELRHLHPREVLQLKPGTSSDAEARHRRIRHRGGGCPTSSGKSG